MEEGEDAPESVDSPPRAVILRAGDPLATGLEPSAEDGETGAAYVVLPGVAGLVNLFDHQPPSALRGGFSRRQIVFEVPDTDPANYIKSNMPRNFGNVPRATDETALDAPSADSRPSEERWRSLDRGELKEAGAPGPERPWYSFATGIALAMRAARADIGTGDRSGLLDGQPFVIMNPDTGSPGLWVADVPPPVVPPARSAAIDPVWVEERLTVARLPALSDLPAEVQIVAFAAARLVLDAALVTIGASASNVDPRLITFARKVLALVPTEIPDQLSVFRLGQEVEGLQKFVDLASGEGALSAEQATLLGNAALQLERCVDQYSVWRDFKRNARAALLSAEQVRAAPDLALALAEQLESCEAAEVVDQSVPNALRVLAGDYDRIPTPEDPTGLIKAGADLLAADLVESIANILKRVSEWVLEGSRAVGEAVTRGSLQGVEGLANRLIGWGLPLLIGGAWVQNLISQYPVALGFLTDIIQFVAHLPR